jgi:AbrB family looped-hinge helix DNA binding protein
MSLRIDKSGRIFLPKTLRQRLRLRNGSALEAKEFDGRLVLRHIAGQESLVKSKGLLVHTGQPTKTIEWRSLFRKLENERLRQLLPL